MKTLKKWLSSFANRFQKTGKQFTNNIMDDLEITDFDHRPIFNFPEPKK